MDTFLFLTGSEWDWERGIKEDRKGTTVDKHYHYKPLYLILIRIQLVLFFKKKIAYLASQGLGVGIFDLRRGV